MEHPLFETTQHSPVTLEALIAQIQSAIAGVLTLNPEEAALRAGVSFLIVGGAAILMTLIRLALRAMVARLTPAEDTHDKTKKRRDHKQVGGLALGLTRLAVVLVAIYLLLRLWGLNLGLFTGG